MKFKKGLSILSGVFIVFIGVPTGLFFVFAADSDPSMRIASGLGALASLLLGWWLIRRVSKSIAEAILWLAWLVPR